MPRIGPPWDVGSQLTKHEQGHAMTQLRHFLRDAPDSSRSYPRPAPPGWAEASVFPGPAALQDRTAHQSGLIQQIC